MKLEFHFHRKAIFWLAALVLLAPAIPRAEASTMQGAQAGPQQVLFSDSEMIQGSEAQTVQIDAPSAGNLFLTLTDLDFPTAFSTLDFALTDAASTVAPLVDVEDPGVKPTLTYDLTSPTTLYAEVFAIAGASSLGLYNLTATFVPDTSPVPLPASGALLLSGVTLLALTLELLRRLRRPSDCDPAGCNVPATQAA